MAPSKEGDDARNGSSSRPSPAHQATPPPARTPSRPSTPSQLSPPPARSPRPRSPLHNLAYRRRSSAGMRIANGIPIPSHMASPGAEGYRTPTIEDYEMHFRQAPQPGTTTRQPTPEPEADRAAAETSSSTDREKGSGAGMNGDAAGSLRARRPSIRFPHLAEGDEHRRSFLERHSNILSPLSLAALSDKLNDKVSVHTIAERFCGSVIDQYGIAGMETTPPAFHMELLLPHHGDRRHRQRLAQWWAPLDACTAPGAWSICALR